MENLDCIQCHQNRFCDKQEVKTRVIDEFLQKNEVNERANRQIIEKFYKQLIEKDDLLTFEIIKENMYKFMLEKKEKEIQLFRSKLEEKEKEILKLKTPFTPKSISQEEWENDLIGTDEDNSFFY